MQLKQKLNQKVGGYWDGGSKDIFYWEIYNWDNPRSDDKGKYVKIGSWEANAWFNVSKGKTQKQTLSYAKRHLKAITRYPSTFEYIKN